MEKEEIINLAKSMSFVLDYDRFDAKEYPGVANPSSRFLRFISEDESLDEKDLRWIWYKEDNNEDNINRGKYIKSRLERKKHIQEMLKY